jgi:hypothetical protein
METIGLNRYWASPHPVVFVTDPMRRNWVKDVPWLPDDPGVPVMSCGFRRVYANQAAWERMEWHNQVLQLADKGRDQLEDGNFPEEEKRLTSKIANERVAAAELLTYVQEHPELRQQRWTSVMSDGDMYFILNRPGERVKKRMAVYCFVGRDFVRFLAGSE